MTIQHSPHPWLSRLAWLLLLAAGACTRQDVDQGVDRVGDATHRAADKLDVSLHKAKDEAAQLPGRVERGGKELGEKLNAFGQQVKKDAKDARDNLRQHVDEK